MKLYRVCYTHDVGSNNGYSWHSSGQAARKAANDYKRDLAPDEEKPKIELVQFEPNVAGILGVLNLYASKEQNG